MSASLGSRETGQAGQALAMPHRPAPLAAPAQPRRRLVPPMPQAAMVTS